MADQFKIPDASVRKAAAVAATAATAVTFDEAAMRRAQAAAADRIWMQISRWLNSLDSSAPNRRATAQTSCRVTTAPIRDQTVIDRWSEALTAQGYLVSADKYTFTVSLP